MSGDTLQAMAGGVQSDMKRLAGAAIDHVAFLEESHAILRRAVQFDVSSFATTDPATVLPTCCIVPELGHDPEREALIFRSEYLEKDLNRFADIALQRVPVATLQQASGGDLDRSWRYRVMLSQFGLQDELRAACVGRGRCWANVTLYRTSGVFSDEDVATVASLAGVMADGIRLSLLRSAAQRALDDDPGMVILTGETIQATSETAERWLDRLQRDRVPTPVLSLGAQARSSDAPVTARVALPDGGWALLHASRMKGLGDDSVGVILEAARGIHLVDVVVAALGLTPRERDVAEQVLQGRSTRQIAAALGVTAYTVQDHLKAIFDKAGVRSRGELASQLLHEHYEPRRQRDLTPGPYGWFLEDSATT